MTFWLSVILFVIQHIPDLIDIIQKIVDLIRGLPKAEREQARAEISTAIKSKDVGRVRDILNHWHKRCEGVACPMDTLGE